jgi:hypothetical protein
MSYALPLKKAGQVAALNLYVIPLHTPLQEIVGMLRSQSLEGLSEMGVRRDKAALSSGCEPHPATAPAGSNRSSHGGNEVAEAFG